MVFIWPTLLWLLLLAPLLVLLYWWLLHRRKKTALTYSSLSLVREAMARASACAATSRHCSSCWPWWRCCWQPPGPWP